jgi:hypothetical protein
LERVAEAPEAGFSHPLLGRGGVVGGVVAAGLCRGKSALDNGTGYSRVVVAAVAKTGDG